MAKAFTDEQMTKFLDSLSAEQKPIVQTLLGSLATQAEAIDAMAWELEILNSARAARKKAVGGITLTALAAKLSNPVVTGPTQEEIETAVDAMQESIKSAQTAQDVFKTILQFGLKIAPLALA